MNISLHTAYSDFLQEQTFRGNSQKTLRYYRQSVSPFVEWIGEEIGVSNITVKRVREYHKHLVDDTELSTVSIQTYFRGIRAFLRYCYEQEYTPINITEKLRLPKAKTPEIQILTEPEISVMLSGYDLTNATDLRNLCFSCLMLGSGLRLGEVVTLQLSKLDLVGGTVIVVGKGNKERYVPLSRAAIRHISLYLKHRPSGVPHDFVFLQHDSVTPITHNSVTCVFRRLAKRTGISRLHPHLLRHTFGTKYVEFGGNIVQLKTIMGHTSIKTTMRYVHLSERQQLNGFEKYSPIDRLHAA